MSDAQQNLWAEFEERRRLERLGNKRFWENESTGTACDAEDGEGDVSDGERMDLLEWVDRADRRDEELELKKTTEWDDAMAEIDADVELNAEIAEAGMVTRTMTGCMPPPLVRFGPLVDATDMVFDERTGSNTPEVIDLTGDDELPPLGYSIEDGRFIYDLTVPGMIRFGNVLN